jgi:hypothetical protein
MRSLFGGVSEGELYASIIFCSDVADFLKSSETDPVIKLVLIAIMVEVEYRSVAISLFRWDPKGASDAPIVIESEVTYLLRLLKLIWQSNPSMLAIRVESEYRSIARSLSGWDINGEPNAPITAGSEIAAFLMWTKMSCCSIQISRALLIGHIYVASEVVVRYLSIAQRTSGWEREP